ncbi:hypothetical protein MLD38_019983 [Melastoma candidum]|uniref:Uncharacterized protein n=1 Tax=Melastoma candidum TaxID=119954 RepID=A0ACB9QB36_9MYRT|nr:hypothetical protein MLD38_019983 [Melastoma candidum]
MATSPAGAATLRLTARRRDPTVALHVDAACRGFACASVWDERKVPGNFVIGTSPLPSVLHKTHMLILAQESHQKLPLWTSRF